MLGVALCARLTREGVHSIVHGPTHPMDGSQPQNWGRRIFPHGESSGAPAGLPFRSHAHALCPLPAARGAHSVCHPSQVAICAPTGAMQTSLVALAQLGVQMRMDRACMRAVYGLRRASAQIAIRPVSVSRLHA